MSHQNPICHAALVQMTSGDDMQQNIEFARKMIREARAKGADFVALPENAFYMRREAHHKDEKACESSGCPKCPTAENQGVIAMQKLAGELGVWILIGSIAPLESATQSLPYNRSVLINSEGEIASTYDKLHLFDVTLTNGESYAESARIEAGKKAVIAEIPWGRLGMTICYDLRFPVLYRDLAIAGASILSVPAAFIVQTGKVHWHTLLKARAIETGCFVIAPAQCGEHPGGRKSYGHSLIVNPWGEIIADGGEHSGIVMAELHLHEVEDARARIPSLKNIREYEKP